MLLTLVKLLQFTVLCAIIGLKLVRGLAFGLIFLVAAIMAI